MAKKISRFEKTAYHEAGHAVAFYLLRMRFTKVTIIEDEEAFGRVSRPKSDIANWRPDYEIYENTDKTVKRIEKEIISSYAGPVAEGIYTGKFNYDITDGDRYTSVDLALMLTGGGEEAGVYLDSLWDKTRDILSEPQNWAAVQSLAEALLVEKEIGYRRARKIISDAMYQYTN